nr:polysaccharide deacetylase family protein [candidate division KSB1 bacterium]NIR68409.1 polysaccharide deacetylase family protein [candidate division KSB1 bacterium]NIS27086.1 polysaccharide deacetylase family protein [candidate division KSB1 bacterium]NIT73940.1 polysaccharide deacetylase family protein [candidate division KSB1 bacterium]NIU27830.1 polysaccharide deacetylase family protein [candidate division KSB1 bacterium]
DDGPDSVTTPKILEALSRNNAKATFFLISSRVMGNKDLVTEIVARGHEIGNHLTYDEPSVNLAPEEFREALYEADSILGQFDEVRWFRPGGGRYNEQMIAILQEHDYRCALGSVYPFDTFIPWVWFEVEYVLHNVQPGSIIILHDVGERGNRTVKALARLVPALIHRGFHFVTLSELYQLKKD